MGWNLLPSEMSPAQLASMASADSKDHTNNLVRKLDSLIRAGFEKRDAQIAELQTAIESLERRISTLEDKQRG